MKDINRQLWNEQQKILRIGLSRMKNLPTTIDLFLHQHAMLHSASITPDEPIHFQEEIFNKMTETLWRTVLPNSEHSIAWTIWHIARIEDMTMNVLLAGKTQLFTADAWASRLNIEAMDTGNEMTVEEIRQLSQQIVIDEVLAYRNAVAVRTREIIPALSAEFLKKKVDRARLQDLLNAGAVRPNALWLLKYWSGLTNAGLLLMPPTRHNFVHLTEAKKLKGEMLKLQVNH